VHSWRVFHFHDTSALAPVRNAQSIRDNLRFKPDASNLAPFLRMLREKHPKSYTSIVETIRMVAPFFKDFLHRDDPGERLELEWLEEGDPDTPRGGCSAVCCERPGVRVDVCAGIGAGLRASSDESTCTLKQSAPSLPKAFAWTCAPRCCAVTSTPTFRDFSRSGWTGRERRS